MTVPSSSAFKFKSPGLSAGSISTRKRHAAQSPWEDRLATGAPQREHVSISFMSRGQRHGAPARQPVPYSCEAAGKFRKNYPRRTEKKYRISSSTSDEMA